MFTSYFERVRSHRQPAVSSLPINQVFAGDCIQKLREFATSSVDMVMTDPPYIANYRSRDGRTIANDNNDSWLQPAFREIYRVLKQDSFCVSFYGWNNVDKFLLAWRKAGFRPVGHFVWIKEYPSNSRVVAYHHEMAYILAKGNPTSERVIEDVLPWEYSGNTLHPTQKPLNSLLPVIEALSKKNDLILDPFCGSGTTLLAAKLLGRRYCGIDLSDDYCQTTRERLSRV